MRTMGELFRELLDRLDIEKERCVSRAFGGIPLSHDAYDTEWAKHNGFESAKRTVDEMIEELKEEEEGS